MKDRLIAPTLLSIISYSHVSNCQVTSDILDIWPSKMSHNLISEKL